MQRPSALALCVWLDRPSGVEIVPWSVLQDADSPTYKFGYPPEGLHLPDLLVDKAASTLGGIVWYSEPASAARIREAAARAPSKSLTFGTLQEVLISPGDDSPAMRAAEFLQATWRGRSTLTYLPASLNTGFALGDRYGATVALGIRNIEDVLLDLGLAIEVSS